MTSDSIMKVMFSMVSAQISPFEQVWLDAVEIVAYPQFRK